MLPASSLGGQRPGRLPRDAKRPAVAWNLRKAHGRVRRDRGYRYPDGRFYPANRIGYALALIGKQVLVGVRPVPEPYDPSLREVPDMSLVLFADPLSGLPDGSFQIY